MTAWLSGLFSTCSSSPALVFVAELSVVTISTLRIIFLSRGMKHLAPVVGFFEITIWLFAIGQVIKNLNSPGCFLGFAAGFTLGNFLGIFIEKQLAIGNVLVRIVTRRDAADLVASLKAAFTSRWRRSIFRASAWAPARSATGWITATLSGIPNATWVTLRSGSRWSWVCRGWVAG